MIPKPCKSKETAIFHTDVVRNLITVDHLPLIEAISGYQGTLALEWSPIGTVLGNGLVNYSASDIRKIKGLKSGQIANCLGEKPYDEVIHRDNLALTETTTI